MKIKQINRQNRRDFYADYECESCGNVEKDKSGYDDANFHNNVIPKMVCKVCGKTSMDSDVEYRPLQSKYQEGFQI